MNQSTPTSHPEARCGHHDIMDGSPGHDLDDPTDIIYHTAVTGIVWPGMVIDDAYVVTECYEEYDIAGDPVYRWFCEPVATPVPRRQSGEPGTPAPSVVSEPPSVNAGCGVV